MRHHLNFPFGTDLGDGDLVPQVTDARIDFYFVVEEFFESGDVEDFVGGGLGCVDDELFCSSRICVSVRDW